MQDQFDTLLKMFKRSSFYVDINDYPWTMVTGVLKGQNQAMKEVYHQGMTQLSDDQLYGFMMAMAEQASQDPDPDAEDMLEDTEIILEGFLEFLAASKKIALSPTEMDELIQAYELDSGMLLYDEWDTTQSEDVFDDPNLPEWRQYVFDDITDYVDEWLTAYLASQAWQQDQNGLDAGSLKLAVTSLTEKMYDRHRKTPRSWTKKGLRDIMTHYWVSNVNFTAEEYPLLVPAVCAFLSFVSEQTWLSPKQAANYQRYMQAIEPEMLANAQDPSNFGFAKAIGAQMLAEGVDMTDQDAIDRFVTELNARGGIDALPGQQPASAHELSDELEGILDDPATLSQVAKQYDPDQAQAYLTNQHLPGTDIATWRKQTAIKVHEQAVEFGLRLWLTQEDYLVQQELDAPVTVGLVCEFVDAMYAQHLQTPAQWTAAAWYEFGDWLHRYSLQDRRGIRQANALAKLALVLGDANIIARDHAQRLAQAIQGEVPVKPTKPVVPTVVKGRKLSNKQLRKVLKNQRH